MVYAWHWKHVAMGTPEDVRVDAPGLRTMCIEQRYLYAQVINEGLDLLKKRDLDGACIMSMNMYNPFPFALGLPSPKGGATFFHYGHLMSDSRYPRRADLRRSDPRSGPNRLSLTLGHGHMDDEGLRRLTSRTTSASSIDRRPGTSTSAPTGHDVAMLP